QAPRLVPLDRRGRDVDRLRSAEDGIQAQQPGALQVAEALLTVVRVIGNDQRANVVVRDVAREDDLAPKRIGYACPEELRSVRSVGEIGRLAKRTIAGDEFDVPVL